MDIRKDALASAWPGLEVARADRPRLNRRRRHLVSGKAVIVDVDDGAIRLPRWAVFDQAWATLLGLLVGREARLRELVELTDYDAAAQD